MKKNMKQKTILIICTIMLVILGVGENAQAASSNRLSYYYSTVDEAYAIKGYTPSENEDDYVDSLVVPNIISDEVNGVNYTGPVLQVRASVFANHKFKLIYFKNEYTMNIKEKAFQNVEVKRPILAFDEYSGSIIFKGDISTIGAYAFNNINLDGYLEFQGKVDTIGEYAMSQMNIKGLKGEYIRVIGKGAFSNNLIESWNAKGTEIIGDNAFEYCTKLSEMNFTDTVTSIGANCFKGCTGLKKVTLPANKNLNVGEAAFPNQSGLIIVIPTAITDISNYHFETMTNVVFQVEEGCSDTISQFLEDNKLQYKIGAEGEVVKDGETESGSSESDDNPSGGNDSENTTSEDNNDKNITADENKDSEKTAVDENKNDGNTTSGDNKDSGNTSGGSFETETKQESGTTSSGTAGDNTPLADTGANDSGSTGNTAVQTIKRKKKPKKGKTYACENMYYKVTGSSTVTFMKPVKKNVNEIVIPDEVMINGWPFKVTKINKKACYKNKNITSVTVGNNVTHVGDSAFAYCKKLKYVTLGTGITYIGEKSMYQDKKIKSLVIKSKKIKKIKKDAFRGFPSKNVNVPGEVKKKYQDMYENESKK